MQPGFFLQSDVGGIQAQYVFSIHWHLFGRCFYPKQFTFRPSKAIRVSLIKSRKTSPFSNPPFGMPEKNKLSQRMIMRQQLSITHFRPLPLSHPFSFRYYIKPLSTDEDFVNFGNGWGRCISLRAHSAALRRAIVLIRAGWAISSVRKGMPLFTASPWPHGCC